MEVRKNEKWNGIKVYVIIFIKIFNVRTVAFLSCQKPAQFENDIRKENSDKFTSSSTYYTISYERKYIGSIFSFSFLFPIVELMHLIELQDINILLTIYYWTDH